MTKKSFSIGWSCRKNGIINYTCSIKKRHLILTKQYFHKYTTYLLLFRRNGANVVAGQVLPHHRFIIVETGPRKLHEDGISTYIQPHPQVCIHSHVPRTDLLTMVHVHLPWRPLQRSASECVHHPDVSAAISWRRRPVRAARSSNRCTFCAALPLLWCKWAAPCPVPEEVTSRLPPQPALDERAHTLSN